MAPRKNSRKRPSPSPDNGSRRKSPRNKSPSPDTPDDLLDQVEAVKTPSSKEGSHGKHSSSPDDASSRSRRSGPAASASSSAAATTSVAVPPSAAVAPSAAAPFSAAASTSAAAPPSAAAAPSAAGPPSAITANNPEQDRGFGVDRHTGLAHEPTNRGEQDHDQTGAQGQAIYQTRMLPANSSQQQKYTVDRSTASTSEGERQHKTWAVKDNGSWMRWPRIATVNWQDKTSVANLKKWREQYMERNGWPNKRDQKREGYTPEQKTWIRDLIRNSTGRPNVAQTTADFNTMFGTSRPQNGIGSLIDRCLKEERQGSGQASGSGGKGSASSKGKAKASGKGKAKASTSASEDVASEGDGAGGDEAPAETEEEAPAENVEEAPVETEEEAEARRRAEEEDLYGVSDRED